MRESIVSGDEIENISEIAEKFRVHLLETRKSEFTVDNKKFHNMLDTLERLMVMYYMQLERDNGTEEG